MKTRQQQKPEIAVASDNNDVNVEENDEIEVVAYNDSNGQLQRSSLRADSEVERQGAFPPSQETESEPAPPPESSESMTDARPNLPVVSSLDTSDAPTVLPRVVRSSQELAQPPDVFQQNVVRALRQRSLEQEQRDQIQAKKRRLNPSPHSNTAAPRRVLTPPISTQSRRPRNIHDKSIHGG